MIKVLSCIKRIIAELHRYMAAHTATLSTTVTRITTAKNKTKQRVS